MIYNQLYAQIDRDVRGDSTGQYPIVLIVQSRIDLFIGHILCQ